jgi:hypothetical protein
MIIINGPGVGLPPPQNLYPSQLGNAPPDASSQYLTLNAGDELPLPAGRNLVYAGKYSVIEHLDYTTGIWRVSPMASWNRGSHVIFSDGFTRRIANRTGCPIAAIVQVGGTGFVQSTATITASAGGSTWQPVVGGVLAYQSMSAGGKGYTMAPLVLVPAPPNPGIQATAYATISAGTVASISFTNFGAGYTTNPTLVIVPNPTDPGPVTSAAVAVATIVAASAALITGALCTNPGTPLTNLTGLTLTAAGGAGAGASIVPVILQTVTANSIAGVGIGFGSAAAPPLVTSVGGWPTATSSITNPLAELTGFVPRPFMAGTTSNAAGSISALTVIDGGLFAGTPTAVVIPGAGGQGPTSASVAPSITFTMGSTTDDIMVQPL